ncbi:MAG: AEC family transporter [Sphaerochaetaceae bacterium]
MVFYTAFSVLFPLFGKIALGYTFRHFGLVKEETLFEINNIIFRVLLPTLVFINIYQTDFSSVTSYSLLWYAALSIMVIFVFFMVTIPLFVKKNSKRGVLIQAITRSNFIFFGMPMALALYGKESTGLVTLLIAILTPLFNINSIIALELFKDEKTHHLKIIKNIVTNPIIIGGVLGLLFPLLNIKLPIFFEKFLADIASITTTLALIVLGAYVTYSSVKENFSLLLTGLLFRLIIVPFVGITISILLGFRGLELVLLLSIFATPTAVNSFALAQKLKGDVDLAGQLVVFSTTFSLITLFFWISSLMALGYF